VFEANNYVLDYDYDWTIKQVNKKNPAQKNKVPTQQKIVYSGSVLCIGGRFV
jgi:hypothetical protein